MKQKVTQIALCPTVVAGIPLGAKTLRITLFNRWSFEVVLSLSALDLRDMT